MKQCLSSLKAFRFPGIPGRTHMQCLHARITVTYTVTSYQHWFVTLCECPHLYSLPFHPIKKVVECPPGCSSMNKEAGVGWFTESHTIGLMYPSWKEINRQTCKERERQPSLLWPQTKPTLSRQPFASAQATVGREILGLVWARLELAEDLRGGV